MRATLALNGLNRGGGVNKQGVEKAFAYFVLMAQMYSDLPMYKQSCNFWKGKKVMKQLELESNTFKCNVFMLYILFFLFKLFYVLTITLETYSNIDLKTKALFTLYEVLKFRIL